MVYDSHCERIKKMSFSQFVNDLRAMNNKEANKCLDNLTRTYGYKAPESRPYFFWEGDSKRYGITDICREYFPRDENVLKLFIAAREAASNGVFEY